MLRAGADACERVLDRLDGLAGDGGGTSCAALIDRVGAAVDLCELKDGISGCLELVGGRANKQRHGDAGLGGHGGAEELDVLLRELGLEGVDLLGEVVGGRVVREGGV